MCITLCERDRTVILSVQDHGKGIESVRIDGSSTRGIRGIQERATLLGGEFSLHGEPGRGRGWR